MRFDAYEADFATGELRKHGVRIRVPAQSLQILRLLVERPGELVSREELRSQLWDSDTFVDFDHGLNAAVNRLRDALHDSADNPRFVETLPRRGYRFIGELGNAESAAALVRPRRWHRWVAPGALALAAIAVIAAILALQARRSALPAARSLRIVPFTSLPGQEVAPAFSPDGTRIAFAWTGESALEPGRFDLYVKVTGSEELLRLTRQPANWISPAWSPDGRSIAFSRWSNEESGIYVVSALGGEERKLADVNYQYPPMMGIAWSPDGKSLVFTDDPNVSPLSVLSVETLHRKPLFTQTRCLLAGNPAFSPDGNRLAFACNSDYAWYGIYVAPSLDGPAEAVVKLRGNPQGLAWSRDGAHIILSNDPGTNEGRLWELDLASRALRPLATGDDARLPALSPDGARLAFARGYNNINVWKVDLESRAAPRRFISSTRIQHSARFSPDGRRIAFQGTRSGAHEVWLADADGSNLVQATNFNRGVSGSPAWCSDSRRIAFDSRVDGPVSVYVEDVLERVPRRLQTDRAEISLPTWSRDCRFLYVADGPAKTALYRVPVGGGPAVLVHNGIALNASESADGGTLFFADAFDNARIWRLQTGRREAEPLADMPRVRFGTAWELAGGGIYFVEAGGGPATVAYYGFASRSAVRVAQLQKSVIPWTGLTVSPLDRSLLYSQVDEEASDIMLAEIVRP